MLSRASFLEVSNVVPHGPAMYALRLGASPLIGRAVFPLSTASVPVRQASLPNVIVRDRRAGLGWYPELCDMGVISAVVSAITKRAHFWVRQAEGPPLVSVLNAHFTALG